MCFSLAAIRIFAMAAAVFEAIDEGEPGCGHRRRVSPESRPSSSGGAIGALWA